MISSSVTTMQAATVRRSTLILCGAAALQTLTIIVFHDVFVPPLFAGIGRTTPLGWTLAIVVAVLYIAYSVRGLPTIGRYLWNVSAFKLVGLAIAVPAAILEEVFFRGYLMNALAANPVFVQIAASAVAFGLAHAVWAIRGGRRAFIGAVGSTTLMGGALAVVFLAAHRVILPCVLGHFIITLMLEPWLVYAYIERVTGSGATARAAARA